MGHVTEGVTEQSRQFSKTIVRSMFGLGLVSLLLSTAANGIVVEGKVSSGSDRAQPATGQLPEFYVSLSTNEHERAGLSTLVVAGSNRFRFDCGVAGPVPGDDTNPFAVTALFLTRDQRVSTSSCFDTPTSRRSADSSSASSRDWWCSRRTVCPQPSHRFVSTTRDRCKYSAQGHTASTCLSA